MVDTDACEIQAGCVLQQEHKDEIGRKVLRPIAYHSRVLNDAERSYAPNHKEALSIAWAVTILQPYLEGEHFTLRTDHHTLKWIMTSTENTGQLARWRLRLQELDFEVIHRPGRLHIAADVLSRLPTTEPDTTPIDFDVPVFSIIDQDVPTYQTISTVAVTANNTDESGKTMTDFA